MTTIKWADKVSIQSAHIHKNELTHALAEFTTVIVDLNDCTSIDLAGMQLLCSGNVTAGNAGKALHVLMSRDSKAYTVAAHGGFLRRHPCRPECGHQCLWLEAAALS